VPYGHFHEGQFFVSVIEGIDKATARELNADILVTFDGD